MKTPYQFRILLDVYSGGALTVNPDAPIFEETVRHLMGEYWFYQTHEVHRYKPSMKLIAFMEHALRLPDPIQHWTMPSGQKDCL